MDSFCHWSFIRNLFDSIRNKLAVYYCWLCWLDSFCCCNNWSGLSAWRWCFGNSKGKLSNKYLNIVIEAFEIPFWKPFWGSFVDHKCCYLCHLCFVHLWVCYKLFKWIYKYEFVIYLFNTSWNVYWCLYTANNYRNASKGQESTHYRWIMIGQKFDWSVRWFRVEDEPVWMNWMVFICSWGALLFEFLIWRQVWYFKHCCWGRKMSNYHQHFCKL